MVPFLSERIVTQSERYEVGLEAKFLKKLSQAPIGYFHKFYGDTRINGNTAGLMRGYAFFGADHMVFGTDMPYDAELGNKYMRVTIDSIERMPIPDEEKTMIFEGNARTLLRLGN